MSTLKPLHRSGYMFSLSLPRLQPMGQYQSPAEFFDALLAELGKRLHCDRIFLYLRSPRYHVGRVPVCWQRHEEIPLVYDPDWKAEPRCLADHDPLFAAALRTQPSLFIDDIETADPTVVNCEFERQTFGHRALVHAHLSQQQQLWGILQACVFDHPHHWRYEDRQLIDQAIDRLMPVVMAYVQQVLHPET